MAFYSVSSKGNFKREFQINICVLFLYYMAPIHNECIFQQKWNDNNIIWFKIKFFCLIFDVGHNVCFLSGIRTLLLLLTPCATSQGLIEQERQIKTRMCHKGCGIIRLAAAFIARWCLWWKTEIASLFSNWKCYSCVLRTCNNLSNYTAIDFCSVHL